jgi:hypothetical protein
MSRATLSLHDELEIFLSLRELLNTNSCAHEFNNETLAALLYQERYMNRRVAAHEVEEAREALLTDDEFVA